MNKWMLLFCLVGTVCADIRKLTPEETYARVKGASACEYLRVIDENGAIVTNVTVKGNFHMNDNKGNPFVGRTDTNGVYKATAKCVGDWHYVLSKDGYYETSGGGNYRKTGVNNGCWQPYGMTNTVVLKRVINPVAMAVATFKSKDHNIPFVDKEIGFDLFENDWIVPNGKGKYPDLHVFFEWDGSKYQNYTGSKLTLIFKDAYSGVYKIKTDEFSKFKSPYYALTNGVFVQTLKFSYIRGSKASETFNGQLKGDECLILRVRTKVDDDGNLVSAHYAKIYGPMMFGYALESPGSMEMRYYLNPNANDPNLEADTTKNLLNPGDLNFAP